MASRDLPALISVAEFFFFEYFCTNEEPDCESRWRIYGQIDDFIPEDGYKFPKRERDAGKNRLGRKKVFKDPKEKRPSFRGF